MCLSIRRPTCNSIGFIMTHIPHESPVNIEWMHISTGYGDAKILSNHGTDLKKKNIKKKHFHPFVLL